jgi:hypothetical protein
VLDGAVLDAAALGFALDLTNGFGITAAPSKIDKSDPHGADDLDYGVALRLHLSLIFSRAVRVSVDLRGRGETAVRSGICFL